MKLNSAFSSNIKINKQLVKQLWGKSFSVLDTEENKVEFLEDN